jgi:hypothetical protein
MATIRRILPLDRPADAVWDAVADVGAVPERLARGFVTDVQLDGDTRVVTFEGGTVATERIVDVDHAARCVTYSVIDSPLGLQHHLATMQVIADEQGSGCRLDWTIEATPDDAIPMLTAMVDLGVAAMQRTLSTAEAAAR